jgi:hypothetical protein
VRSRAEVATVALTDRRFVRRMGGLLASGGTELDPEDAMAASATRIESGTCVEAWVPAGAGP